MINVASIWLPEYQQQNYRALLDALSYPGRCQQLHFDPDDQAFIALLASLLDKTVTLADPHDLIQQDNFILLQARLEQPDKADFIICRGSDEPNFEPALGSLPSPELSATVILLVNEITVSAQSGDLSLALSGPGIESVNHISIKGLSKNWLQSREQWVSYFPLGIDMLLVDKMQVMALPRTTKVEIV